MATVVLNFVKNLWPFSYLISNDDLRASDRLVNKLNIPESTKRFVYAIQEPKSGAVIYVLCVQNLSERSALDAEFLIREVKPEAVIAQVGDVDTGNEIYYKDEFGCKICNSGDNVCSCVKNESNLLPTSSFEVMKNCFVHKINRERYENVAGNVVLKEIFGVDFNGHFLSAKKAAEEIGASFLCLESPFVKCDGGGDDDDDENRDSDRVSEMGNQIRGLGLQLNRCVRTRMYNSKEPWSLMGSLGMNSVESQMIKSISSSLIDSSPIMKTDSNSNLNLSQPVMDYEPPQFAQSIYPLFVDLHGIFNDIPSMSRALAHAQKMFVDINNGQNVDTHLLSEVYVFQIAVEGLRIALNHAGRLPINESQKEIRYSEAEFFNLPIEEKSHVLVAEALRSQTKRFQSVVAIIDSRGLAGLRKHWNTYTPIEIKDIVEQLVTDCVTHSKTSDKNRLLSDKPVVVAIGAGATAVLGASSLSKLLPVSTFSKILTLKLPASIKLAVTQTQKVITFAFGKSAGPSKLIVSHGLSPEKIRTIAHGIIASIERTSLSAMRSAFYEIMRKRSLKRIGFLPWATFGCSIATCGSLIAYGDGIECAAESFPSARSIASLGRGIRNLHEASQAVRRSESNSSRIQKSIESLLYRFRRDRLNWGKDFGI